MKTPATILTVGHSTRPLEEFIALLAAHSVTTLFDVRTVPRSRHNPQFNADTLATAVAESGIRYEHVVSLGGFRRARPDSPNTGWRNASFRGYADYMQSEEFAHAIDELVGRAGKERIALMCAEAVAWRCHRSLIADALTIRGVEVEEIVDQTRLRRHALTPFAAVDGTRLTYPAST